MRHDLTTMAARIEHWPLDQLIPYDRNPRTHSEAQVAKIAASMIEFGFTQPILVDGERGIIAGHGRLRAAQKIGLEAVPVIQLSHLTAAQKRAYVLADNRLAEDAGWDEALLAGQLSALNEVGYDLALTGFDEDEIAEFLAQEIEPEGLTDDDAAPAPEATSVTLPGDVWILGSHRLLCGDATKLEHVERLMGADRADCVWTDPPYNVAYESGAGIIANDDLAPEDFAEFLRVSVSNAAAIMRPGAAIYIAHSDLETIAFRAAMTKAGLHIASCLIWRKNTLVLGHSDYHWQHEPILYGWREGAAHAWYGGRDKTTLQELGDSTFSQTGDNEWQIALGETTLIVRGENLTVERAHGTVFFEEKPVRSADHPTMKPVALIERMLGNSTRRGDVVVDLFAGAGATLIACQKLQRRSRLIELEPKYCDVIVRRWQEYTGKEAVLERTGETFADRAG